MINIENKFKDNIPENTIKNIELFFESNNCNIKIKSINNYNKLIYSCTIELYYIDKLILQANGKGTSETFALASGYAELYERFCAAPTGFLYSNKIFQKKFNEKKFKNINFKNEIIPITYENYLNNDYNKKFFELFLPSQTKENFNLFINLFFNNNLYAEKYYSLNNKNNFEFFNDNILWYIMGTHGLAAGNSLNEALVQGLSEIYERKALDLLYAKQSLNNQFYYIDFNCLPKYLQNIINNLKQQNYQIYIFDLSYNFNLPVVCLLLQDKINHQIYFNFGSFPIFSIAVERCFTEIFQGYNKLPIKTSLKLIPEIINLNDISLKKKLKNNILIDIFPKNLILNSKLITNINTNIFLNDNEFIDNDILLKKMIQIADQQNFHFFYKNISLSKDIFAVRILSKEIISTLEPNNCYQNLRFNKQNTFNIFIQILKCINSFEKKEELFNNLFILKEMLLDINKGDIDQIRDFLINLNTLIAPGIFHPFYCGPIPEYRNNYKQDSILFFKILFNNLEFTEDNLYNTEFYKNFIPFYYINIFLINNYQINDIKRSLKFFGYNEDIINNFEKIDESILLEKIFIEPLNNVYISKKYDKFINIFLN